jgi:hypothetical protein
VHSRGIDGGPFAKTFAITVDGEMDPRFTPAQSALFSVAYQEMSGEEINEHNTSNEGPVACPEQHER